MKHISDWIISKLTKYTHNDEYLKTALSYGVNMALYTIFSTLGLLLVGYLMGNTLSSIIIIAVCYSNQTVGGGFHASTHLRCFLTMVLFLTIGIFFSFLEISYYLLYIMGTASLVCLFHHPVVLHPRRNYLKSKLSLFVKRSRWLTVFELLALYALLLFDLDPNSYVIALSFSALSRITAYFSRTPSSFI